MGGRVFDGSKPIKKEDIKPTLSRFIQEFSRVFPKAKGYFEGLRVLGSAGKKPESGDIDLCLDEKAFKNIKDWGLSEKDVNEYYLKFKARARTATKQQIMKRAIIVAIGDKLELESSHINIDTKGAGNGTLFCQFPQYNSKGDMLAQQVQIDLNIGNIDWLSFAYYSDSYEGNVKGLHRTQLVLSLFLVAGYSFSHNYGVKNKETGEIVAQTPQQAIGILSNAYNAEFSPEILNNYFKLQEFLKKHLDEADLHEVWDAYLSILDRTRCDIPNDLQEYWIENQDRLGLTGKFLPKESKLYMFREDND